jgi:hypothetical protein
MNSRQLPPMVLCGASSFNLDEMKLLQVLLGPWVLKKQVVKSPSLISGWKLANWALSHQPVGRRPNSSSSPGNVFIDSSFQQN